ncbi:hypothetical protein FB45DRAFT_223616 [Roridomyces roridus]|uniref:Uncharacterized protein n=1 Tax=Roridomyces roridus TaxID=1738132 RepID=A0AAD7BCF7_9AGAR|nr:hypothetical protein FB45DRAFT_223616 [Roridomyces roridus]
MGSVLGRFSAICLLVQTSRSLSPSIPLLAAPTARHSRSLERSLAFPILAGAFLALRLVALHARRSDSPGDSRIPAQSCLHRSHLARRWTRRTPIRSHVTPVHAYTRPNPRSPVRRLAHARLLICRTPLDQPLHSPTRPHAAYPLPCLCHRRRCADWPFLSLPYDTRFCMLNI